MSDLATVLTVGISIGSVAWWLRGQFVRIDKRFERLERRFDSLVEWCRAQMELTSTLIPLFLKHVSPLDTAEIGALIGPYFRLLTTTARDLANPLTSDEQARLDYYIQKGKSRQPFSPDEARDFVLIVDKLEKEHPNDRNVLILTMIAAFFVGLYLGGRRPQPEE